MSRSTDNWVEKTWYGGSPVYWLLLPFTALFTLIVATRRFLYSNGILKTRPVKAPVIVVGNISAGGTGKTPVTIWLARELKRRGQVPGIISRGYRGNVGPKPVQAIADSDLGIVGDEAVLLASQSKCPVVVHPDRVAAAEKAIELGANIIISDDGLQHYRLARDFEIAVVDGDRRFGNGMMLPAGPLREPVSRLNETDKVLVHRDAGVTQDVMRRATDRRPSGFRLEVTAVSRLDASEVKHIDDFTGKTVHAVAGIGHPERFFRMLESHGIEVHRHPLPDHADIGSADITFDDGLDVLMTEKDAVKCRWMDTSGCWYVPVGVIFGGAEGVDLSALILGTVEERRTRGSCQGWLS